jgi:hypothetical protein
MCIFETVYKGSIYPVLQAPPNVQVASIILTRDPIYVTSVLCCPETAHGPRDRFKVVKIDTAEPVIRGRWACVDFVDRQNQSSSLPPSATVAALKAAQQQSVAAACEAKAALASAATTSALGSPSVTATSMAEQQQHFAMQQQQQQTSSAQATLSLVASGMAPANTPHHQSLIIQSTAPTQKKLSLQNPVSQQTQQMSQPLTPQPVQQPSYRQAGSVPPTSFPLQQQQAQQLQQQQQQQPSPPALPTQQQLQPPGSGATSGFQSNPQQLMQPAESSGRFVVSNVGGQAHAHMSQVPVSYPSQISTVVNWPQQQQQQPKQSIGAAPNQQASQQQLHYVPSQTQQQPYFSMSGGQTTANSVPSTLRSVEIMEHLASEAEHPSAAMDQQLAKVLQASRQPQPQPQTKQPLLPMSHLQQQHLAHNVSQTQQQHAYPSSSAQMVMQQQHPSHSGLPMSVNHAPQQDHMYYVASGGGQHQPVSYPPPPHQHLPHVHYMAAQQQQQQPYVAGQSLPYHPSVAMLRSEARLPQQLSVDSATGNGIIDSDHLVERLEEISTQQGIIQDDGIEEAER